MKLEGTSEVPFFMDKQPLGRPSKYDPAFIKIAEEYMAQAIPQNMKIPTIEGLSLRLDVDRTTLYEWRDKYPDFSHTLGKLMKLQKEHLIETGIFGGKEINATIVSLLLKVNHDMIETEKKIVAGDENRPIEIKIISSDDRITDKELPETTGDIQLTE